MPPRKRSTTKRRSSTAKKRTSKKSSTQKGRGVLSTAHRIVKDNKLISKGLAMTPLAPLAGVAAMLGYGKKKRSTRKKATKRKSAVAVSRSRPLKLATVRKSATRSRVVPVLAPRPYVGQVGGGIFSDIGGGIGSVFGGLGSGVGSVAHGLFGGGRKKKATSGKRHSIISI